MGGGGREAGGNTDWEEIVKESESSAVRVSRANETWQVSDHHDDHIDVDDDDIDDDSHDHVDVDDDEIDVDYIDNGVSQANETWQV